MAEQFECAVFVQLNDLYHIDFLMDPTDPKSFMLPRITTILKRLREYSARGACSSVSPAIFSIRPA